VFDSHGNLDIAEAYCNCIRQVSPAGIISTVFTLPQQPGYFQYFEGLAIDSKDNLYAAEYRGSAVWKIAADGSAATIAGTGVPGFSGDGGPATAAQLNGPSGVTVGSDGSLYIADTMNQRVRRIAPDGTISTFAGTGVSGFSGDGGPATAAQFFLPAQTLFDSAGNLYISDYGNSRVRVVSLAGIVSTVAGNGLPDPPPSRYTQIGDGGPALDAIFNTAVAGNSRTCGNPVDTVFRSDGVQAVLAPLCVIVGLTFDAQGAMYIPEAFYGAVLKVSPDGTIHRVVGSNTNNFLGDGGPPLLANLQGSGYYAPSSVAFDANGDMFLPSGTRIREVIPGLVTARLSKDRIDFQKASPPAQSILVATNVAEPMPFAAQVKSGGGWLSTNRPTGQTGDLLTVSANSAGLAPGVYSGSIQISIPGGPVGATLPVTLTVQ
jgi:hypothetical protein